jgi:ADP-ribose pyrophosphatase
MMFEITGTELVFRGRAFDVRRDNVQGPGGRTLRLDVVEHSDSVTIVPVDEQGDVWLINQYRHPSRNSVLELPAGVIEYKETPDACAAREIREEIGMAAGKLLQIGSFFLAPGYSTEFMYVYLATGLYKAPLEADEDEFISVERMPFEEAFRLAEAGDFQDVKTIGALFLARPHLV